MKAATRTPYAINLQFIIAQVRQIPILKTAARQTDQTVFGQVGYGTQMPAADHQASAA